MNKTRTRTSELKRLRERIMELEAMVAMAEPPSPEKWPLPVCISWRDEQKKLQRKLDKVAEKTRQKGGTK